MKSDEMIKCPCCGKTYVGAYDICTVCGWENDPVQLAYPNTVRGANRMTLNEARTAYQKGEPIT